MSGEAGRECLREDEDIEDLMRGGLRIIQSRGAYRFGLDAVLLSGFAHVKRGGRVCDLGTGCGVIPILMSERTQASFLAGIEIQPDMADMAGRSVALNGLQGRVAVYQADLRKIGALFEASSFDAVTANPPYIKAGHGRENMDGCFSRARHEVDCTLSDVAAAASCLLKNGGRFFMVHRPERLGEIFESLGEKRLEIKRLRFVHPFAGSEAKMVLIEAVRGGKRGLTASAPLVIYSGPGAYSREMVEYYGF